MIVAIHQPQYLPWVPYFDKADRCDVFVYLDNVQFQRGGVQNRNQLRTAQGAHWLVVPVTARRETKICDVRIASDAWQRSHIETIHRNYARAAHYAVFNTGLRQLLEQRWTLLVELNIAVTEWMFQNLDIRCRRVRASSLNVDGRKEDLLINITQAVGGSVYLSGSGARAYQDEDKFSLQGIELRYQSYRNPVYLQQPAGGAFVPDLSALDLLLNVGPGAKGVMESGRG